MLDIGPFYFIFISRWVSSNSRSIDRSRRRRRRCAAGGAEREEEVRDVCVLLLRCGVWCVCFGCAGLAFRVCGWLLLSLVVSSWGYGRTTTHSTVHSKTVDFFN